MVQDFVRSPLQYWYPVPSPPHIIQPHLNNATKLLAVISSALTPSGAFGSAMTKGILPVRSIWRKNISTAVAIGTPSCFKASPTACLTIGCTQRFVVVFSIAFVFLYVMLRIFSYKLMTHYKNRFQIENFSGSIFYISLCLLGLSHHMEVYSHPLFSNAS